MKKALRPNTKLAWVETPSNPLLKLSILPRSPNSFTTPARFAFAIIHGRRCYSGHSISAPILFFIRQRNILAAIATFWAESSLRKKTAISFKRSAAFNTKAARPLAFRLLADSARNAHLPWRMRAHSENAMKVADFLAQHRKVEAGALSRIAVASRTQDCRGK